MKETILSLLLATLFGTVSAEARSCHDEPERCPILRWSCVEQTPSYSNNYVYLSAIITNSIFTGDSLLVTAHFCSGRPVSCRQQKSEARWSLYPAIPQGYLLNKQNGQRVIVNCNEHNRLSL